MPQRCPQHREYAAGCDNCRRLARTRARARHHAAAYGWIQPAHVPAAPARQHITALHSEHSMSISAIAQQAGVSFSTVHKIANGVTLNSQPQTVAAILAVKPVPPPVRNGLTVAVGAMRRLQGLAYAHYSSDDLAPMLDLIPEAVRRYRSGTHRMIAETRAHSIRVIARHLDGTWGPSPRARAHALRQGWVSLAAWDDIDDPRAKPSTPADRDDLVDDVAIEMALNGELVQLTRLERHHAVHRGQQAGMTLAAIQRALRMSGSYVNELAHRPLPTYDLAA
ncbi:hypothetical protein GA0070563_112165 [Micromonospora carbonacea]|uniref:Uncharacterized protein n=2 Tax=Micromonospora carbonacea TaxID=47853 RepID=A0A1C5ACK1_9ACTN|nr:hypothetical protein GA0070563_112165 [Micromonospora carbonacea]